MTNQSRKMLTFAKKKYYLYYALKTLVFKREIKKDGWLRKQKPGFGYKQGHVAPKQGHPSGQIPPEKMPGYGRSM